MKRQFRRRVLSPLLFAAGAVLLIYVAGSYIGMYREQKNLEEQWNRQAAAAGHSDDETVSASQQVQGALTRLVVPRISLDAIVVEGVTRKQLLKGPGHMAQTAVPGEKGNAVITAHRDTFFRHIYELEKGDDILVRRRGQVHRFQVTGKKIVKPEDVYVLHPTPDAQLTLITCYPTYYIGPAPERLVVFSKLVDTKADNEKGQSAAASGTSH